VLNRRVKQIYPPDEGTNEPTGKPFKNILEYPNLILLGDPGAGKSYLFENACPYEKGILHTAQRFLVYKKKIAPGQVVYVDALDEKRSSDNDTQTIDTLTEALLDIRPSKFRLSCRVADWMGGSDLSILEPYTTTLILFRKRLSHIQNEHIQTVAIFRLYQAF